MNHNKGSILNKIMPFIGMGIFIFLIIVGIIFLSYVLLIGAIIGLILFAIASIRNMFITKKQNNSDQHKPNVYDHDDFKK